MNNEQDRQLALAAIGLDHTHAGDAGEGEKPDFEELWDWSAGQVSGARALQIQSHVARDPDVYTQWREIRLALDEAPLLDLADATTVQSATAASQNSNTSGQKSRIKTSTGLMERIFNWLTPAQLGGGFATAAILGVAVSIGLNQSGAPQSEFWSDWQSPKSLDAPDLDKEQTAELQAFLVGMGQQMRKLSIPTLDPAGRALPEQVQECPSDDEQCSTRRAVLIELGELSVNSRLECLVSDTHASTVEPQRLQDIFQTLESDKAAARLISPLRQWATAEDVNTRCGAVSNLIQRGLIGIASVNI